MKRWTDGIAPKRDENPEVEKALGMDLRLLQPGEFAGYSPLLQMLLTVRMLYEDGTLTEHALAHISKGRSGLLLQLAQEYIIERDPAFARVPLNWHKWAELHGKLDKGNDFSRTMVLNMFAAAFRIGKDEAEEQRNADEVMYVAENVYQARNILGTRAVQEGKILENEKKMRGRWSLRPVAHFFAELREVFDEGLSNARDQVPADFWEKALKAREKALANHLG